MQSEGVGVGLTKKLSKFSITLVVTMWYRTPRLFYGLKGYKTTIDMWALGRVFAEFVLRKTLF